MTEPPDLPLTPEDVAQIVAILDGGPHQSLEITTTRFRLRLDRREAGGWTQDWRHTTGTAASVMSVQDAATPDTASPFAPIRPPLPGVFYRAPQPGAAAFVALGDTVGPDTVIGIIETMKVMNSVPAGVAGVVVEILAEDGQQVGIDTVLMRVRPRETP
jgi:acetyl-CoA carboxylase biotin carboxyl carrier protein